MPRKRIDITGNRYNQLVILSFSHMGSNRISHWHVRCDCGNEKVVSRGNLISEKVKSCGCIMRGKLYHMVNTSTYKSWAGMKARCSNPKEPGYHNYGGRGIVVCERWLSFENFFADMGVKPEGMTIEREDNNGNYEPSNCRWATKMDQANNTRTNVILTHNNISLTMAEWARKTGIGYKKLHCRLKAGWSVERALTTF